MISLKKTSITLFFSCLLVCAYSQQYKHVTAKELNIRKGEGTNYSVIGKVYNTDSVYVISEKNGWTKILLKNGQYGFVSSAYLEERNPVKANLATNSQAIYAKKNKMESIPYIVMGAIIAIILSIVPQNQRKAMFNVVGGIILFILSIVTLGIFRGHNNWKNDR